MSQALRTAVSGMAAQQLRMDTIANNIANVNTNSFKKSQVNFSDAVYTTLTNPADTASTENLQRGHGTLTASTKTNYKTGIQQETGRSLDLAIQNEGFFALEQADGTVRYTRDGAFQTSDDGANTWLVNSGGQYLLDTAGRRIGVPSGNDLDQAVVSNSGQVVVSGRQVATIGVWQFANEAGLEATGSKSWQTTAASGEAQSADPDLRQGFLEQSNVDLTDELSSLIVSQRAYALIGRAISVADNMKATENDIRR